MRKNFAISQKTVADIKQLAHSKVRKYFNNNRVQKNRKKEEEKKKVERGENKKGDDGTRKEDDGAEKDDDQDAAKIAALIKIKKNQKISTYQPKASKA